MIEHRNVANFFAAMDRTIPMPHGQPVVWLAVTSLSFDISVLELLWTLTRGFKVVIHDEARIKSAPARGAGAESITALGLGLFMWGNDDAAGPAKYRLLIEGAKYFDENGFAAVWTPERHFHAFGGPYPNPAVTGAAVAAVTKRREDSRGELCRAVAPSRANRGGVGGRRQPLERPRRDRGRVGLESERLRAAAGESREQQASHVRRSSSRCGSLARREARFSRAARQGRRDAVVAAAGPGRIADLDHDRRQPGNLARSPVRVASTSRRICSARRWPRSARRFGSIAKPERPPASTRPTGQVALMLHTFVGEDDDDVRELVRKPMKSYLASSMRLAMDFAWSFPAFKRPGRSAREARRRRHETSHAGGDRHDPRLRFERYFSTSGLFGTRRHLPARCLRSVRGIGVTEIACLLDFGVDTETVMQSLPHLNQGVSEWTRSPASGRDVAQSGLLVRGDGACASGDAHAMHAIDGAIVFRRCRRACRYRHDSAHLARRRSVTVRARQGAHRASQGYADEHVRPDRDHHLVADACG